MPAEREIPDERVPCHFCSRKFSPSSLLKHAVVCEKTSHKKRKTFDSAKQRIQGTELAEFLPVAAVKKNDPSSNPQPKEKILANRRVIDTAPNVPSRKHNSKVASPFTKSSNYERCPYCDRSFGPKAFDRHIEWCKEQSIRINAKSSATQEAKERLEARIKYRAPSFRSRRSITKEKYSSKPNSQDSRRSSVKSEDHFESEIKSAKPHEPTVKMKISDKSKPKDAKEVNFIRQNVLRCSYKPKTSQKADSKTEKDNSNLQSKKTADYADVQNWISVNGTKMKQFSQSSKPYPDESSLTSSMYDDYDPYLLAEHQMKELFNDDHSGDELHNLTYAVKKPANASAHTKEERLNKCQNKENISGPVKTISCQTDGAEKDRSFKTSPTSAFNKYSATSNPERGVYRTATPVPDEYNFLPPITNARREVPNQAPHEVHGLNRYPLISLSNLSLCSSVSIDIPEDNRKLGNCKSAEVRNDIEPFVLKRSVSASNEKPNKNAVKKNLKMENMLYGSEEQKDANTTYTTDPFLDEYDQKLEKINNLLDGEGFDLMNSFTEFENVLQNSYYDDTYTVGSESSEEKTNGNRERGDSLASKLSIDSAYNSLNRKSPTIFDSQHLSGKTSTPETDALKSSTLSSADLNDAHAQGHKLSKFCHECGAKFPLAIAKFCCECGVRRLVI